MARRSDQLGHSWSGNSLVLPPIQNQHHSETPNGVRYHHNTLTSSGSTIDQNLKAVPNQIGRLMNKETHLRNRTLSSPVTFDRQRANSFTAAGCDPILSVGDPEAILKQSNSIDAIDHKKMLKKLHHRSVTMLSINHNLSHGPNTPVSLTDKALLSPKMLRSNRFATPIVSNNIELESSKGGSENRSRPVSIDDYKSLLATGDPESEKTSSAHHQNGRNHDLDNTDHGISDDHDDSAFVDDHHHHDHKKKQQVDNRTKNQVNAGKDSQPANADIQYDSLNRAKCERWLEGLKDIDYSMPTADVITNYDD